MSSATTEGIRVQVRSRYLEEQSQPLLGKYLFAYTVQITNDGERPAQLVSRHWVIVDAHGHEEHVEGEGVVGKKPLLQPGETTEYASFCPLPTPHGAMHGTYRMVRPDGSWFDATIAPFTLAVPNSLN
jgi:ApaG protein